jgi:hypothetical protein
VTALDELRALVERGGEPDDVLRSAVALIAAQPGIQWAAVAFVEDGELALGPEAGTPDDERRLRAPVEFQGETVGELWVDGDVRQELLQEAAALLGPHVLIGWDTRGEAWEP